VVTRKHEAHVVLKESKWAATFRHIIEGLHLMGNRQTMGRTALISLLYLVIQVVSVWALMKAYKTDFSFWVAGAVLVIIRFATVIPNAPGNIGVINVACVMALGLFDMKSEAAKTFSFILFGALTLPLLIGGAIATALSGVNIGEIRERAHRSARQAHPPPAVDTTG